MRTRWMTALFLAPLAIAGMLLFVALGGWIVMALWNWLLPPLFGWPELGFWQALALLALCRILFGGRLVGGRPRSRVRERVRERIRQRMDERSECMSPEERERFRRRARERWGFDVAHEDDPQPSKPAD